MTISRPRSGFTLFEILVSTLIIATGSLVVLALLPAALQKQQDSRYKMIASMHAQTLVEGFIQHEFDLLGMETEIVARGNRDHTAWSMNHSAAKTDEELHDEFMKFIVLTGNGQFDLEKITANRAGGNYPVPPAIARRLDSPNDEIQKILDSGGQIYYSDPIVAGRLAGKYRGVGGESMRSDMMRLVWGVVGEAQNNVLPFNPVAQPHYELYPFPPLARYFPTDRRYFGSEVYEASDWKQITYGPGDVFDKTVLPAGTAPFTVWQPTWELQPASIRVLDAPRTTRDDGDRYFPNHKDQRALYQGNNWEWYAHRAEEAGETAATTTDKWLAGREKYRHLVYNHWLRIVHQIMDHQFQGREFRGRAPGATEDWEPKNVDITIDSSYTRIRKDDDGKVMRGPGGVPLLETVPTTRTRTLSQGYGPFSSNADKVDRGYPAPAKGVGQGHLGGTDILEEDGVAHGYAIGEQMRIGLPSLERRVMYRTAALALWAEVAFGKDITRTDNPNAVYLQGASAPAGKDVLLNSENPLHAGFLASTHLDAANLHPTMVLALSHLAHAAVMVTGYKPPFVHSNNTPQADDDFNLLPEEDHPLYAVPWKWLPYKAVDSSALFEPGATAEVTTAVLVPQSDGSEPEATVTVSTGKITLSQGTFADAADFLKWDSDPTDADLEFADHAGNEDADAIVINPDRKNYLWNPYADGARGGNGRIESGVPLPLEPFEYDGTDVSGNGSFGPEDYISTLPHLEDASNPTPTALTFTTTPASPDKTRFQVDESSGLSITYRRMVGEVINEFSPPYADLGAFNLDGTRSYDITWMLGQLWTDDHADAVRDVDGDGNDDPVQRFSLLRLIRDDDYNGTKGLDSELARRAHEHALTAAMTWVSENPYDFTVPKPMNRQAMIDRGIFQFEPFGGGDTARRNGVGGLWSGVDLNPIAFPFDQANRHGEARFSVDEVAAFGPEGRRPLFGLKNRFWLSKQRLIASGALTGSEIPDGADLSGGRTNMARSTSTKATIEATISQTMLGDGYLQYADGSPLVFGAPPPRASGGFSVGNGITGSFYRAQEYRADINDRLHGYDRATAGTHNAALESPLAHRVTATKPFQAQDRARQIVYWLVDWSRYADAESAPSAPTDLSMVGRATTGTENTYEMDYIGQDFFEFAIAGKAHPKSMRINDPNGLLDLIPGETSTFDAEITLTVNSSGHALQGQTFTNDNKSSVKVFKKKWNEWFIGTGAGDSPIRDWFSGIGGDSGAVWNSTMTIKLRLPKDLGLVVWGFGYDKAYEDARAGDKITLRNPERGYEREVVVTKRIGTGNDPKPHVLVEDPSLVEVNSWPEEQRLTYILQSQTADSVKNNLRFLRSNPEFAFTWLDPERTVTRSMLDLNHLNADDSDGTSAKRLFYPSEHVAVVANSGNLSNNLFGALGTFGADRNGDGEFTEGTIESHVRMEAREVARFNFYDPVAWVSLRR